VGCVGPPPDDSGGSALALVARSDVGGLRRAVSGCLHIARLAEELLAPRRSRFQHGLPFEFCHGSLHAWTGAAWQPCKVREHYVSITNRVQCRRIGHWSREDDGLNPGFKTYGDKSLDQFTLLKQVNLATQFMNMVGGTKTPGWSSGLNTPVPCQAIHPGFGSSQ